MFIFHARYLFICSAICTGTTILCISFSYSFFVLGCWLDHFSDLPRYANKAWIRKRDILPPASRTRDGSREHDLTQSIRSSFEPKKPAPASLSSPPPYYTNSFALFRLPCSQFRQLSWDPISPTPSGPYNIQREYLTIFYFKAQPFIVVHQRVPSTIMCFVCASDGLCGAQLTRLYYWLPEAPFGL